MCPHQSKYRRWKCSVFHTVPEISLLYSALHCLAVLLLLGLIGRVCTHVKRNSLRIAVRTLKKFLSKQSLGKARNGQWLEKRFRAYFRENKWLKTISRFVLNRAVDFLLFRLYVRKKGNWNLVA